jgi:hypothetical protein
MNTVRLDVCPRGKGYVAQSTAPNVTALGSSPEEAVESARLIALTLVATGARPSMLLVYLEEPGIRTVIMQPMDKAFAFAVPADETRSRYMVSATSKAGRFSSSR